MKPKKLAFVILSLLVYTSQEALGNSDSPQYEGYWKADYTSALSIGGGTESETSSGSCLFDTSGGTYRCHDNGDNATFTGNLNVIGAKITWSLDDSSEAYLRQTVIDWITSMGNSAGLNLSSVAIDNYTVKLPFNSNGQPSMGLGFHRSAGQNNWFLTTGFTASGVASGISNNTTPLHRSFTYKVGIKLTHLVCDVVAAPLLDVASQTQDLTNKIQTIQSLIAGLKQTQKDLKLSARQEELFTNLQLAAVNLKFASSVAFTAVGVAAGAAPGAVIVSLANSFGNALINDIYTSPNDSIGQATLAADPVITTVSILNDTKIFARKIPTDTVSKTLNLLSLVNSAITLMNDTQGITPPRLKTQINTINKQITVLNNKLTGYQMALQKLSQLESNVIAKANQNFALDVQASAANADLCK